MKQEFIKKIETLKKWVPRIEIRSPDLWSECFYQLSHLISPKLNIQKWKDKSNEKLSKRPHRMEEAKVIISRTGEKKNPDPEKDNQGVKRTWGLGTPLQTRLLQHQVNTLRKIMVESSPNLGKEMITQIQEAVRMPNKKESIKTARKKHHGTQAPNSINKHYWGKQVSLHTATMSNVNAN